MMQPHVGVIGVGVGVMPSPAGFPRCMLQYLHQADAGHAASGGGSGGGGGDLEPPVLAPLLDFGTLAVPLVVYTCTRWATRCAPAPAPAPAANQSTKGNFLKGKGKPREARGGAGGAAGAYIPG